MTDNNQLAQQIVEDRARAKTDKFFLANSVLGFDFQECHAELFACFPSFDSNKPWAETIRDQRHFNPLAERS